MTTEEVKRILSNRDTILDTINSKIQYLLNEMYKRSDDELIIEKSLSSRGMGDGGTSHSGSQKDLSDLLERIDKAKRHRMHEMQCDVITLVQKEEEINRVWSCFLALPDPYYTILHQLYVENELYETVMRQFEMPQSTFDRYLKKGLSHIMENFDTGLTLSEIMNDAHKEKKKAIHRKSNDEQVDGQFQLPLM